MGQISKVIGFLWFLVFFPHPLSHRFHATRNPFQALTPDDTGLHGLQLRVQALDALPAALPAWQRSGQVVLQLRLPVVALGLWETRHGMSPGGSSWSTTIHKSWAILMGFCGDFFWMFYKTTQKTWRYIWR